MDQSAIRNALLQPPTEKSLDEAGSFIQLVETHGDLMRQVAVRVPARITDGINPRLSCALGAWSQFGIHWDPKVDDNGGFVEMMRAKMVWDFLHQDDLKDFKYLLMIDNDMEPSLDLIWRLARWDVPVIGGMAVSLHADHGPMLCFTVKDEAGLYRFPSFQALLRRKMKVPLGKLEVGHIGTGALMIRRDVLESFQWESVEDVPFMVPDHIRMQGARYGELRVGEDIWFCNQVRKRGFGIYVDTTAAVGHRKSITLALDDVFKDHDGEIGHDEFILPMDGVVVTAE